MHVSSNGEPKKPQNHEFPSWTCHVSEDFGASLTISRTTWFPPHRSTSALRNRSICSLPASLGWENLQETNADECQIQGCPPVCSNISGSEIPTNGGLNGKFIYKWIAFVNHIPFPTCFSQRTMKNPWCYGKVGARSHPPGRYVANIDPSPQYRSQIEIFWGGSYNGGTPKWMVLMQNPSSIL